MRHCTPECQAIQHAGTRSGSDASSNRRIRTDIGRCIRVGPVFSTVGIYNFPARPSRISGLFPCLWLARGTRFGMPPGWTYATARAGPGSGAPMLLPVQSSGSNEHPGICRRPCSRRATGKAVPRQASDKTCANLGRQVGGAAVARPASVAKRSVGDGSRKTRGPPDVHGPFPHRTGSH